MAVTVRVEPINRDIQLMLEEDLSPAGRSRALAEFAREQIADARETNRSILGRVPRSHTTVDGRRDAALESVRPDGVIFTEFELLQDVLLWIGQQLEMHSPVKSGRYKRSHTIFADGQEVALGATLPEAEEYVFISTQPYARKLERKFGVYQAVQVLASRRFGNIARITFSFRTVVGAVIVGGRAGNRSDERNPAIIVRVAR